MTMNNNNTLLSLPFPPPHPQLQPNYPPDPHQSGLMIEIPIYISLSHATMEELSNTPLNQIYPTPLLISIVERLTGSLIRLATTQLELTQELTTLELYNILHQPTPLSNLNMQHLQLDIAVSGEEDHMKDQVVPQIYTREPSPPIHHGTTNEMREEALNIPELHLQTLYLRNYLTIDMQQNIEKKIMIKVPKETPKTSLNIRCYNINTTPKYKNLNSVNLEMTLAPGGKPTPHKELSMKILLWNCSGARYVDFKRNLQALIDLNNPTILALTETKMEDHDNLLQTLEYTVVIQVPGWGYSGGIALFWKSSKITIVLLLFSVIYEKNLNSFRKSLWNSLSNLSSIINGPWLVCGDFNEVTNASEKLGGRPINNSKCSSFINCLDHMGMIAWDSLVKNILGPISTKTTS
ncbi:hypothetical protein R3W88_029602 [Solanum pinnatisectum]|uniref:Endonuclease/exonuclease/phosphatase domain-containing protein n=1 Tax=Solanum pinnatisectum TaxID=50273 RepID=A0AAV9K602_9SOLN|nr:hypothetical protein R3W88_029602 [Solanum pinnatisectum]